MSIWKRLLWMLFAMASSPMAATSVWVQEQRDTDTVSAVWAYINHKDCAGAAREITAGVAKNYPGVLLLAGAMFEDGICLKQNWSKAVDFYQRANAAGHPRAAARLASGYAAPVGGPDKAAALWWAIRGGSQLPSVCVQVAPLLDDADRFIQALDAWPKARLDACVYVAGVVNTILGDVDFSSRAALYGMKGAVLVTYLPSQGRIDIDTERVEFIQLPGVVDGDAVRERDNRKFRSEFALDVKTATDRALRRYAKPAAIDEAWRLTMQLTFEYATCATCR